VDFGSDRPGAWCNRFSRVKAAISFTSASRCNGARRHSVSAAVTDSTETASIRSSGHSLSISPHWLSSSSPTRRSFSTCRSRASPRKIESSAESPIYSNLGLHGLQIHAESLAAIMSGGVAFATPNSPGHAVKAGSVFQMHSEVKDDWLEWSPLIWRGNPGQAPHRGHREQEQRRQRIWHRALLPSRGQERGRVTKGGRDQQGSESRRSEGKEAPWILPSHLPP
jgi:hypothetical protein